MPVVKSFGSVKVISINKKELMEKLKKVRDTIKREETEVIDIRIFGSIAKNEETGVSDLDILIILRESKETPLKRILKYRKYFNLGIPVDILVYTEEEIKKMVKEDNFFIKNILKESISI